MQKSQQIANDVKNFTELRDAIKLKSGDYLDLKRFNPAMRSLIDMYIKADESNVMSSFADNSLIDIIALNGIGSAIDQLPKSIKENKESAAETIENNMRKLIVDERDINPAYYDNMSKILSDLIEKRKEGINDYEAHLKNLEKMAKDFKGKQDDGFSKYPDNIKGSSARKALFDNLNENEELAIKIDEEIISIKQDNWRNNIIKKRQVKNAIAKVLEDNKTFCAIEETQDSYDEEKTLPEKIYDIVYNQDEY